MPDESAESSDKLLAVLIASGRTIAEAAELARCNPKTVSQLMADPAFRRRVSQLRGEMVATVIGRLTEASTKAVDTLVSLLRSNRPADRRNAAVSLLETLVRLRGEMELEERLNALEEAANATREESAHVV